MIELKDNDLVFAKVKPNAIIPSKEDENAGYDIYACFDEDYMIIPPHSTVLVPTGIASAMSDSKYLQAYERGSTGKIGMKYGAGVVDSSYRGEIFIALNNINSAEIFISKMTREELIEKYGMEDTFDDSIVLKTNDNIVLKNGNNAMYECYEAIIYPYEKAIAQLVVHEVHKMNVKEISYEELKAIPSKRGDGALGSSGK